MNWFDWLFPSQANAGGAGLPTSGGLGQILEPQVTAPATPQSQMAMEAWPTGPVPPMMPTPTPGTLQATVPPVATSSPRVTPDGSTTPDQSAPEMASQQAGMGWQDRLAGVLKNVKAPAPPDVVKPSTPPPPRPHAINNDFTRILLARAQAGGGQPSIPLALGRVLGGR